MRTYTVQYTYYCFGSGSNPDSIRSVEPDPEPDTDPDPERQHYPQIFKKVKKCHVLKCWMFSFEGEGVSCSLDVLYGGLGISKLQFMIKKIFKKFPAVIFFNFWSSKPWIRIGSGSKFSLKCWIRIWTQ